MTRQQLDRKARKHHLHIQESYNGGRLTVAVVALEGHRFADGPHMYITSWRSGGTAEEIRDAAWEEACERGLAILPCPDDCDCRE